MSFMATTSEKPVTDLTKNKKESKYTTKENHLTTNGDCKRGKEKGKNYLKTGKQVSKCQQ